MSFGSRLKASEREVKEKFRLWNSIRDAEHREMTLFEHEPKRVVNPKVVRYIGFAYSFRSSERRARLAAIVLLLDMASAIYRAATGGLKEQVVEEYARPDALELQEKRKAKLHSELGFRIVMDGLDHDERIVGPRLHGPPLVQEEFRSSLQELLNHFRRTRVAAGETVPETAVYILPSVLGTCIGGTFTFEPEKILPHHPG